MSEKTVDVAIIGGGLAGNLLARQLRMTKPELSVVIFEREAERTYKVGESTVEIAANYFIRKQNLSRYMYFRQLPKNSLRFFFDTPQRDGSLDELSEIGVDRLAPLPAFQLDRVRLEEDLLQMNRDVGTDVRMPAAVKSIRMGERASNRKHQLVVDEGGEQTTWNATWLIDASGRASLLANQLDLRLPVPEHRIVSSWARIEGMTDIDAWPNHAFRKRCNYTSRSLSTNHFVYPGYWFWFIPLAGGLTSVGVVQEREKWKSSQASKEGLLDFMREHKACAQLLEKAKPVDFGMYNQLAYRTKKWWDGGERWATIGDAGAFHDPFYSPGSDYIALGADCLNDVITRDFAGEDVVERAQLMNDYIQFRFETTLLLYVGLYGTFGSYELYKNKAFFDCSNYYNLWVEAFVKDEHLEPKMLRYHLRRKDYVMESMRNFNRFFRAAADEMMKNGTYYRGNLGNWVLNGIQAFGVPDRLGVDRSNKDMNDKTAMIFNKAYESVHTLLKDTSTQPRRVGAEPSMCSCMQPLPIDDFLGDRDLLSMQPIPAAE